MPHITLVRRAQADVPEFPISETEPMECAAVSLMRSQQGRNGMNYTEIDRLD
jgi:2'-5' RNA ligase